MQIPIISGIYRDGAQLQPSYPVNLVPTPKASGISTGYLRPADGLVQRGSGLGGDRGAISWQGEHYRVSGQSLVAITPDWDVTALGTIPGTSQATMDYGFDRLMIVAEGNAYYYTGTAFLQITDPDLGSVIDGCWIDGYFLFTDGASLIVTELSDPMAINPLKYGSSEADPDPVVAVKRIRTELYAINRYSIEAFDNVGAELFPFQRIEGALVNKGAVGTRAVCVFTDNLAFVGGGRNESIGVFIAANANARKISTPDIDAYLSALTPSQLATLHVECRLDQSHQWIYVHCPDRTYAFDLTASEALEQLVWFVLTTTLVGFSQYRARNIIWVNNAWAVGDPQTLNIGVFDESVSSHWGQAVRWEFSTSIIYNKSNGAIFNRLELQALVGQVALGVNPLISTSYSVDGVAWSMPRTISLGTSGDRTKRLVWLQQGNMRNWRIQRFQGDSTAKVTPIAIEAEIEALSW